jgi:hypothetical protein
MKSTYKQRIGIEAVYDGESNRRILFAQFLHVLPQDSSKLLRGSFPLSVQEYHIDKLSLYINEFYLANGIKELLKEHAFDLSLLLNKVTNDSRGMVYRIACCQHNTHCRNEILWFKNRDTTT